MPLGRIGTNILPGSFFKNISHISSIYFPDSIYAGGFLAMRRKWILIFSIPVLLILISSYLFFSRHSFEDFAMDMFRREIASSTLDLHYTLTDPDAWNIAASDPSFGDLSEDALREEQAYLLDCRQQLDRYQKHHLSGEDSFTAELLDWWIQGQLEAEELYYYQEPLGPTLGIQAQLPILLAEYPFRSEKDIDTYLSLLKSMPDYFEQIADFEREKSEQGLFMNDEILERVLEQCQSLLSVDESHFLVTSFRERLDKCDFLTSDRQIAYEAQNLRALRQYVISSYQNLCRTLELLRGTGTNPLGLYHTPEGIRYYEHLLHYSIGTSRSIPQIHRMLELQMESDYETILYALHQGTSLPAQNISEKTPEEILSDLQGQIRDDFPKTSDIHWQIKDVPESLENFLSPAFYMTPAIDAEEENVIYINPSFQPDQNELVTTLAHEGYPGHMYQNSFEHGADFHPIRNLIYVGGYTEGWGLYSEFYAYDYLGLTSEEAGFLRALSSLNYAVCASLDLSVHSEGWTEEDCTQYLASFGITDAGQIHELYLNILEEPSNYLKYYLGYLEICTLKESAQALSSDLSSYDFHKWFLESGPAPFFLLEERLGLLKVGTQLLQSSCKDIQFLGVESVHNALHHFLMECRMLLISSGSLLCQGQQYNSLIFCTADTGHISLLDQAVDGSG